MANHKSSEKRARQDIKRTIANKSYLSKVKTAISQFLAVSNSQEKKPAEELTLKFEKCQSLLHKAATKGLVHKKNASRRIGRLASHLAAAQK